MRKWVWLTCSVLFGISGVLQYQKYWAGDLTKPASAWVLLVGAALLFVGFLYNVVKDYRACHSSGATGAGSEKGAEK